MTPPRPANGSRAYWELRAEQVMDRVFAGETGTSTSATAHSSGRDDDTIEVEVRESPPMAPPAPAPVRRVWPHLPLTSLKLPRPRLTLILAGSLACLSVGTSIGLWSGWNEARQDLRQERNLRLLEGIRSLGSDAPAADGAAGKGAAAAGAGLPPPPPSEPWIQELGQLENGAAGGAPPLQVPLSGTLQSPAPAASASAPAAAAAAASPAAGAVPELLGVVQIPGKAGSAIFQVGGSSANALVGESIGSSGWRLVSTAGDSAVISRDGVSRRVSISSGF